MFHTLLITELYLFYPELFKLHHSTNYCHSRFLSLSFLADYSCFVLVGTYLVVSSYSGSI